MSIDAIKSKSQRSASRAKQKTHKNNKIAKPKKTAPAGQKLKELPRWIITVLAIIIVGFIWLLSLKMNWQKVNEKSITENNQSASDISDIKQKFNDIFNQTSQFIDSFEISAESTSTSTSTPANEAEPQNNSLSDDQIKEISNTLKELEATNN